LHLKDRPDRALIPNPTIQTWQEKYGTVPVVGGALRAISPVFAHRTTIDEVIAELSVKFATVTGMNAYMQNLPPIQVGGELTKSQYQLTLQSPDTQELYRESTSFQQKMAKLPGLQDVTSDLLIANPQVNVNIDRDKASALGVTAEQIEDALYTAYGQRQVSTIYAPNDEYWVIMELEDKYQKDPAALSMLYIRSTSGTLVPLNAVASLTSSLGPLTVNHFGQLPAVTISFNLANDTAIGDAVDSVKRLAREELPPTVTAQFQGTAKAFEASLTGLGLLLLMAILVIYIVLGILYESFIHPITILSGLPSAAFGALLTLQIFHLSLDLYGFVGVIMLIGIVKKNAIMMVDFAVERERTGHKTAAEAIYEGCLIRFRPITMTTMAALMGTAPIAFGIGAGADARRPLGLAVVGGLIFSQMVTLYLTPVFYTYMDTFQGWLEDRFGKMTGKRNQDLADGHVSAD
jgi:HAE1 family hydrophobic/amphiphilic exporter-1